MTAEPTHTPNRKEYRGFVADNLRWDRFTPRDGDIVICTPAKAGTTWMQTLVALLIFEGPEFPARLSELSPWLDMNTRPVDEVIADLDRQTHRRFVKTHTPLDGLVLDDRITYVCVGRDPRDAAVSMAHHLVNMDLKRMFELRFEAVGLDDVDPTSRPPTIDIDDLGPHLREWMDAPATAIDGPESLAAILHHVETFFANGERPNVARFHYDELKADLPGQLLRLAEVLEIELTAGRARELAIEGSLDRMRARASELAPNASQSLWKSDRQFFRSGATGEWAKILDERDLRHYAARVAELASVEVSQWVHQGPI